MFFVVYIYIKRDPLANNQPKNTIHYEERTNTWDLLTAFLLEALIGCTVAMASVWLPKEAITRSLAWLGIYLIILACKVISLKTADNKRKITLIKIIYNSY